jgi:molybdate transport system regulatory protein
MKTTARKQLKGTVKSVEKGAVNAEVVLDVGGIDLVAIITNRSVDNLGLAVGKPAWALVKATHVILTTDETLKTSARNALCGPIAEVEQGAVNGVVVVKTDAGPEIAAVVTMQSIRSLGLGVGVRACALIKASHVILAVEQ